MSYVDDPSCYERWARFRFAVIGGLLSDPPAKGQLRSRIQALAQRNWQHPITAELTRFSFPTIERWYYLAKNSERDPLAALRRQRRHDAGEQISLGEPLRKAILAQYKEHMGWSYRLHYDNLQALTKKNSELGELPSYATIRRFMKQRGFVRRRQSKGEKAKLSKEFSRRERRSFECTHVNGLWHLDFHHGSRRLIAESGEWVKPLLLAVVDDRSRICCHMQWYFEESARALVHGLCQALQKRGLPRALMTDNGAAMVAGESQEGLIGLSINSELTLPYSPEQNGKQERFWGQIEGRLLPMLENVEPLDLSALNEASQAWVELDYNRKFHSEIGCSPLERFVSKPEVRRDCPSSDTLRFNFTICRSRQVRCGDGTVSVLGKRFEIPSRYRQLKRVWLRFARWDLGRVWLVDPIEKHKALCRLYPLDKARNADGRRRIIEDAGPQLPVSENEKASGPAPLLQQLLEDYSATGLPPAYVPMQQINNEESEQQL